MSAQIQNNDPEARRKGFFMIRKPQKKAEGPLLAWWQPMLILFARLSAWIAVPVVVGVFAGRYVDKILHTEPIFLLVVVGFAFVISTIGLVKESVRELKKIEQQEKERKEKESASR